MWARECLVPKERLEWRTLRGPEAVAGAAEAGPAGRAGVGGVALDVPSVVEESIAGDGR